MLILKDHVVFRQTLQDHASRISLKESKKPYRYVTGAKLGTYTIAVEQIPNLNSRREAPRKKSLLRSLLSPIIFHLQQPIADATVFPNPLDTDDNNCLVEVFQADGGIDNIVGSIQNGCATKSNNI